MTSRWLVVDRATQYWVRATGRRIEFADYPWLQGPVGDPDRIGDQWLKRKAPPLGGEIVEGGGLIQSMASLRGSSFDPACLNPAVIAFYEATSEWRLDVWSQWAPVAWVFGWLLTAVFARRLDQLSLPLRPLDPAMGMDSRVLAVVDHAGHQVGAAWVRTLRSTGETLYSGWYGTTLLPGSDQPSVRVIFPLPNGSAIVFLRPEVGPNRNLRLISPLGDFGDEGAYLVVARNDGRGGWARRVPLAEQFDVYVDDEGVLRTDHVLRLWWMPVIQLHYRLERRPPQS